MGWPRINPPACQGSLQAGPARRPVHPRHFLPFLDARGADPKAFSNRLPKPRDSMSPSRPGGHSNSGLHSWRGVSPFPVIAIGAPFSRVPSGGMVRTGRKIAHPPTHPCKSQLNRGALRSGVSLLKFYKGIHVNNLPFPDSSDKKWMPLIRIFRTMRW